MGVQSSEMIDSMLILYVLCPSLLLAATRIWARSDDKKCTVLVLYHTYAQHTHAVHELLALAMVVMCTSRRLKCIHLCIKILGVFVTDDGFTNIVYVSIHRKYMTSSR